MLSFKSSASVRSIPFLPFIVPIFAWNGPLVSLISLKRYPVFPMYIQSWFPLGLTGLISLLSEGLSRVFSSTTVRKHQFFGAQPSLRTNSQPYMTPGKIIALTIWTFVGKVMSLLFNTLSRFVIAFLPRSKCLLIFWLQSPSTVILELKIYGLVISCRVLYFNFMAAITIHSDLGAQKNKICHCFHFSPSICHEVMRPHDLCFLNVEF